MPWQSLRSCYAEMRPLVERLCPSHLSHFWKDTKKSCFSYRRDCIILWEFKGCCKWCLGAVQQPCSPSASRSQHTSPHQHPPARGWDQELPAQTWSNSHCGWWELSGSVWGGQEITIQMIFHWKQQQTNSSVINIFQGFLISAWISARQLADERVCLM